MAWGWLPVIPSIMRHAPEDGPSGDILAFARRMEADGTVLAAHWARPASTPWRPPSQG